MWVFGYGSLMWDGWERRHQCLRRVRAELPNYVRSFNKASIRNWGSKERPGPTLNVTRADGSACQGIAFEFDQDKESAVLAELKRREGGFTLTPRTVQLADGGKVAAVVPIYAGKNLISIDAVEDLARMVVAAQGTSGQCIDYVRNIARTMRDLGICDDVVAALAAAVAGLTPTAKAASSDP